MQQLLSFEALSFQALSRAPDSLCSQIYTPASNADDFTGQDT